MSKNFQEMSQDSKSGPDRKTLRTVSFLEEDVGFVEEEYGFPGDGVLEDLLELDL